MGEYPRNAPPLSLYFPLPLSLCSLVGCSVSIDCRYNVQEHCLVQWSAAGARVDFSK